MVEKIKIINDFEKNYWKIDDDIKRKLLNLSIQGIVQKILEWQMWSINGAGLEIGGEQ